MAGRNRLGVVACLMLAVLFGLGAVGEAAAQRAPIAGQVHALTIFARFSNEGIPGEPAPDFARQIFVPERPGSLTHYYTEMSRGQFLLTGDALPIWYTADHPASEYPHFGHFVREILRKVDGDIDFSQYDSDGDGYVDFIFLVLRSVPRSFIVESLPGATGIAHLGLNQDFFTSSTTADGRPIRIRANNHPAGAGGAFQQGHTFEVAVGSMAHEFGHFLGLPDLYDLTGNSAGVGYWCLMGHGNRGWNEQGGPNPLSAWSLKQLGWLGVGNEQVTVLQQNRQGVVFADVNDGGQVYQLPISGTNQYLLIEHRRRGNSYYERNLPGEGLLIWQIDEQRPNNNDARHKKVTLVCADGRYADAGFPKGQVPAPIAGRCNLDFWSRDEEQRTAHAGNLGDGTDPFDGIRFTDFSIVSNPAAPAGISVTNIHPQGQTMVADLKIDDRRRAGLLLGEAVWEDTIEVVGDLTVEGRLSIRPGTVVRFTEDLLRQGADPERVEVIVHGTLTVNGAGQRPVRFTSAGAQPRPGDWQGIVLEPFARVNINYAVIEYAVDGLAAERLHRPLELEQVTIRHSLRDGIRIEGVEEQISLSNLQVHHSGGVGARLAGTGLVRITFAEFRDNRAGGLVRRGGFIEFRENRLVDNGLQLEAAANLMLGKDVFGTVRNNTFSRGVGIRCEATREVLIADNQFDDHRIGLISENSSPRISGNRFHASELVFQIFGGPIPHRLDLNAVQQAGKLMENHANQTVVATYNWWGQIDEEWIAARISGQVAWQPFLNFDPRQPVEFSLEQNFPNPFTTHTTIRYTVGINEPVVTGQARTVLEVRQITGGLVRRLIDEPAVPGTYEAVWDANNEQGRQVASGVYYYQLQVGPMIKWRRLLFVK